MTLTEAQTLRAALFSSYLAILSGGVSQYSQSGGGASKSLVKLNPKEMKDQIDELDAFIDRMQNGTFAVAQFRNPD